MYQNEKNINFIINRNRGWGFQEAELTYDLPLEILIYLIVGSMDGGEILLI